MLQKDVIPKKWMSARLGMMESSLDEVLELLPLRLQMRTLRYLIYKDLVAKSLYDDLSTNLPGFKFRVFSDEDASCQRLHIELEKVLRIGIQKRFCKTSERMAEEPRQLARDFDCFTLEAVSARHQVWLDFRKPLSLYPDRCSKLFYAENPEDLLPYSYGQHDPEDMSKYTGFLAEQQSV